MKIIDVEELIGMVPHPAFRSSMTAQRVAELSGSATPSRRLIRRQFGLLLVAAGSRLANEAHATHAPRRAAA